MSNSLEGLRALSTYPRLLQIANAGGLDATLRTVRDGQGDPSALSLSTTAVGVPLRPGGLSADLAEYLARGRRDATVYGVDNTGATDVTASLKAVFEMGGMWYFPAGIYFIQGYGEGSDTGGVTAILSKNLNVLCHPDAIFRASDSVPMDNDFIRFNAPGGGAGLPVGGIEIVWIGGYFDQTTQCVSTSVPQRGTYPPPPGRAGASATNEALSFRLQYSVDGVTYAAARSTYVAQVTFNAGAHWQTGGGDSAIYIGEGTGEGLIENCQFYASRDTAIYGSGITTGRQSLTVQNCFFESCFFGIYAKRGLTGFRYINNVFRNCVGGMGATPVSLTAERGLAQGNISIGCSFMFRATLSDENVIVDNHVVSMGAFLADGVTPVAPYSNIAGVMLEGSSRNTVADITFGPVLPGQTVLSHGVYTEINSGVDSNENTIINILTTDYDRCVSLNGGTANYVSRCYNFGTAGIRNPFTSTPASVVRRDVATGADVYSTPLLFGDGTSAAPIITRATQTSTGIWFANAQIGMSTGATTRFDVNSSRAAFAVPVGLPPLTTAQRDALIPQAGWTIFNTTTGTLQTYNGSAWV